MKPKHHVEVSSTVLPPTTALPPSGVDPIAIEGFDHIEIYTDSAKQSSYFLSHAFGFNPVAYRGRRQDGTTQRASSSSREMCSSCSRAL